MFLSENGLFETGKKNGSQWEPNKCLSKLRMVALETIKKGRMMNDEQLGSLIQTGRFWIGSRHWQIF